MRQFYVDAINQAGVFAFRRRGTVLLDFGSFPGTSDASVFVQQLDITATALPKCFIFPLATVDHSADEHSLEYLEVNAGNVVAGSGFTVYGLNDNLLSDANGYLPRIWGKWTIAWEW